MIVSIQEKRIWNRWIWERPWIGFPSLYARSLGWIAASHPYPAGFIPAWEYFAWRDFAKLSRLSLAFGAPSQNGARVKHEGVLARELEADSYSLLIYKTVEEKYPYPPEWELVLLHHQNKKIRRLGYFSTFPKTWFV